MNRAIKAGTVPVMALVLILAAWQFSRLPSTDTTERQAPQRFAFQRMAINEDGAGRGVRTVAPAYRDIRSWISSVGAAVGIFDAQGDGRTDDLCLVDPRTDQITVRPAPGGDGGYRPVVLRPGGLPYTPFMAPMGCLPADLDEDGDQDLLGYYWGRSPIAFLNSGGLTYTAQEVVQPYQVWSTNAVSLADVDGDGHADLVVGNYFPDGARVLDPAAHQDSLQMQDSMSRAYNGGSTRVLLSTGTPGRARFTEARDAVAGDEGHGWTLAVGAQDLDGDGLPELYLGNDFGPDRLLHNRSTPGKVRLEALRGPRGPLTPKSKQLGMDSFKGMGVTFTEINGDAVPDIVVGNITEEFALQESNFAWTSGPGRLGDGWAPYTDTSEDLGTSRAGWSWDVKAADFDADGVDEIVHATGFVKGEINRWPELQELALANDNVLREPGLWLDVKPGDDISGHDPNVFFAKGADGRYADVADRVGLGGDWVSRGVAVGDVNADGRPDLAMANQWDQSHVYLNTAPADASRLTLRLSVPAGPGACATTGTSTGTSKRPALGAAVTVRGASGPARRAQLYYANGHGGFSAPEIHLGLGTETGPLETGIRWTDPCGKAHTARTVLRPGLHHLLLTNTGTIQGG